MDMFWIPSSPKFKYQIPYANTPMNDLQINLKYILNPAYTWAPMCAYKVNKFCIMSSVLARDAVQHGLFQN